MSTKSEKTLFLVWPETTNATELSAQLTSEEIWNQLQQNKGSVLGVSRPRGRLQSEIKTLCATCYPLRGAPRQQSLLLIEPTHPGEIETVLAGSDIEVMALAAPTG